MIVTLCKLYIVINNKIS